MNITRTCIANSAHTNTQAWKQPLNTVLALLTGGSAGDRCRLMISLEII